MSRKLSYILGVLLFATSCELLPAGYHPPKEYVFLTGECLASPELSYQTLDENIWHDQLLFRFTLDLSDTKVERIVKSMIAMKEVFRTIPSDEKFRSFGSRRDVVKNEFNRSFDELRATLWSGEHDGSLITIVYDGGDITFTANRDFAGHPAGENLAPDLLPSPYARDHTPDALRALDLPLEYDCMLEDHLMFAISMDGFELVKQPTTYDLEIPVKVIMYLNWLNDLQTDPDAPVPYREEVLRCRFHASYCLQ